MLFTKFFEYVDYKKKPSRAQELNETEFMEILKNKCTFWVKSNIQLYRQVNSSEDFILYDGLSNKPRTNVYATGEESYQKILKFNADNNFPDRLKSIYMSNKKDNSMGYGIYEYLCIPLDNSLVAGIPTFENNILRGIDPDNFNREQFFCEKYDSTFNTKLNNYIKKLPKIQKELDLPVPANIRYHNVIETFSSDPILCISIKALERYPQFKGL